MSDDVKKDAEEMGEKLGGLLIRALEAREMSQMLKEQLEKDGKEIDDIIDVMGDALKSYQKKRVDEGAEGVASLSVAAAAMMIMYSIWHQVVENVEPADRNEQFHLLRIAFMALMSDMKYNGATTDVN